MQPQQFHFCESKRNKNANKKNHKTSGENRTAQTQIQKKKEYTK